MTSADIAKLAKAGAKIVRAELEKEEPEERKPEAHEVALLKMVETQKELVEAIGRQQPPKVEVEVEAPKIEIPAAQIHVPPHALPKRWVMKHSYDHRGDLAQTVVEAEY